MRAPTRLGSFSFFVYVFLYAPILVLAAFSFNKGRLTADPHQPFSKARTRASGRG